MAEVVELDELDVRLLGDAQEILLRSYAGYGDIDNVVAMKTARQMLEFVLTQRGPEEV